MGNFCIKLFVSVGLIFFIASSTANASSEEKLSRVENAATYNVSPFGELPRIFALGGDHTDIQRKRKTSEIVGKVVEWTLTVYDVRAPNDNYYKLSTSSLMFADEREIPVETHALGHTNA